MQSFLNALPAMNHGSAEVGMERQSQPYLPLPAHRKRVAVIAPSAAALVGFCHGVILDMINRGHRVFAFAPDLSNKDLRILAHIGAEAYALAPMQEAMDRYRRFRELTGIFRDIDPHAVLVQSARNSAISVAAAKLARVPHVVTVVPSFGPAFMEGARRSAWPQRQTMKTVYKTIFRWSNVVIFHSAHDQKFAERSKLVPESKAQLTVGGWGEDLMRNFQKPLPAFDKGVLFLMAAPLDHGQGVIEYCEAAKAIRLKARRARFFLASTVGESENPIAISELKRYREFIQYIGPVEDAASVIARCHVVVSPSYGDGAPRALFQGLSLGRPIITTDTRSCRDFAQNGLNGYRVAVRDTDALVRGISQILARPDLIPLMAEESRRIALRFFDINAVNSLVLETLGL